ncbi:neuferricin isoform X2 [Falco cherrug]|uniref:neuferricin isoform X2 n=1 Tax=Falco cherrug TaxID=345164 RepID=UPI00247B17E5|nr:neuferricin isoform X2 [Falco cherrug]
MWRGAAAALLCLGAACLLGRGFDPRAWLLPPPPRGRLLSVAELARYRGAAGEPGLYLAVLGRVFDVERGRRHYGPGGAYSGLAGKLVGRFYDEDGAPTEALRQAEAAIEEALKFQAESEQRKQQFPPCNSEWNSAKGSRFWCSRQSGGVKRDWTGVPRKLYQPGSRGSHCVCVRTTGPSWGWPASSEHNDRGDLDNPHLEEYEGCHPLAEQCVLKV